MSTKRAVVSEHYVVTLKVERVTKTGTIPYNGTAEEATDVQRTVSEVGTANITDESLATAIDKTARTLSILGE